MFARIQSGVSYANVMATIAVFIALGSGSYAATTINSNNRPATTAKKKHKAKVKAGPRGPRGLQGLAGTQGAQGTAGANGQNGAAGPRYSQSTRFVDISTL